MQATPGSASSNARNTPKNPLTSDPLTYKRSSSAALLGLSTQIVLLVVVGLLSLFAESAAFSLLTYHLFGGVFIWGCLWLLHNQHRLERIEALEAEALAANDQTAATIFDEAGDQLALARTRLGNLYKYVLPGISLGLAIYLLSMGTYWAYSLYGLIDFNTADGTNFEQIIGEALSGGAGLYDGALALVMAALTFATFVVARYIAGMTKVEDWSTLRGGAAFLMGNAVSMGLVSVGLVGWYFKAYLFLALVPAGLAVMMVALGIEIVFSFIFGVYRPRKKGETPRIAFDSRLLGWLVRPESLGSIISETINYQFGLEISKTWFYQLIGRALAPLVLVCMLVLLGMSSIVVVGPEQMAVVTGMGKGSQSSIVEPGIRLKAPWPIGGAIKQDVTKVRTLAVGSYQAYGDDVKAILWTNAHHGGGEEVQERFLLTAPPRQNLPTANRRSEGVSGGLAAGLAGGRLNVNYRIAGETPEQTKANLWSYVNSAVSPEAVLQTVAERELANYFATHDITHLLADGRADVGNPESGLAGKIQSVIDAHDNGRGLGLQIVHVALTSVHPPQGEEVAASFHNKINASYEKEVATYGAKKTQTSTLAEVAGSVEAAEDIKELIVAYRAKQQEIQKLPVKSQDRQTLQDELDLERVAILRRMEASGGLAAQELTNARAKRWEIVTAEATAAARFLAELTAYNAAPAGYFETRMFYEVLARQLPSKRVYIDATNGQSPANFRLDLEDRSAGSLITGQ